MGVCVCGVGGRGRGGRRARDLVMVQEHLKDRG